MTVETRLLIEANKWLIVEHAYHNNIHARHVMASRTSDGPCMPLAVAWLRRVAETGTRQALWASVLLRDMSARGLIETRRNALDLVSDLKARIEA